MDERLNKAREERIAREQGRILKLRELNRKKYDIPVKKPTASKDLSSNASAIMSKSEEQHKKILLNKELYGIKYTKNRQSSVYPVNFISRPETYVPPVDGNVSNKLHHVSSRLSTFVQSGNSIKNKEKERKHLTSPTKAKYVINNKESVFTRLYRHALHRHTTMKPQNPPTNTNTAKHNQHKPMHKSNNISSTLKTQNTTKAYPKPPIRSASAIQHKGMPTSELSNTLKRHSTIAECINPSQKVMHSSELQTRLNQWLKNRGKSLSAYHHLTCFGVHHLPPTPTAAATAQDDEDKENIPQDIPDDASYTDNLHDRDNDSHEWRRASVCSEGDDSPMTPAVKALMLGALKDIYNLLCEGYSGSECNGWLRALRRKCPTIADTQLYWQCCELITQLPENNSNIPELSLEPLLSTFQKLQISSDSNKATNNAHAFNSTHIKIASLHTPHKKLAGYTLTPVRRSSRLSVKPEPRIQLADISRDNAHFVVNKALHYSP